MAKLVLGIGSSHGPTIQTPPEGWARLADSDTRDPRFDFQELLRGARPGLDQEIAPERQQARYAATQAALQALAERVRQAALDVVVVVSNPHRVWPEDNQPVFGVFRGASLPVVQRTGQRPDPDSRFRAAQDRPPEQIRECPGQPDLANHLIRSLIEADFDVACTDQLRGGVGLDEAFTFLYERFLPEGRTAMVPFILSRYLPSQATARRCYALGGALRRAIETWGTDARVGLMASGGLSHQIVDEELDHAVIDALIVKDRETLCSLSVERLNRAPGTPETLNWVVVAAAMAPLGMTLVDYVPCYRSLAGTGHGVTFGYWTGE
jgi:hypothetical protein